MALLTTLYPADVARRSMAKGDVEMTNALALYTLNMPFSSGGIAIATTTTKVKTVSTVTYQLAGINSYSLAATDNFWTLSGTVVAAASWQKYLLLVDSAGTASIQEGTQSLVSAAAVTYTNVSGLSKWAPLITVLNAGKIIAGYITVATDATHTFTPGTTALGATGITTTYTNGLDQALLPIIANQTGLVMGVGG
jgi:hypothetical protein